MTDRKRPTASAANACRAGFVQHAVYPSFRALALAWLFVLGMHAAPVVLHVSPSGRDSWSGRPEEATPAKDDGPMRTLPAALAAARELRRKDPDARVTLELLPGRYELAAPLELGPEDSDITIAGNSSRIYSTISGGSLITGWTRSAANKDIWETTLPEVAQGKWYFNQLFVRGERVQRARTPNTNFFRGTAPLSDGSPIELAFRNDDIRPEWAAYPDARIGVLAKWTDMHLPIAGVDAQRHVARLSGKPKPAWMDEPAPRYWVENVPDALDAPGEWYLDRKTGLLRYWATPGNDPDKVNVAAPRLTELVRWRGSADGTRPVTNITLKFLRFAECDYAMPAAGMQSPQAAVDVPGTLNARHAVRCIIDGCRFETLGGYGLEIGRGCKRWGIIGCDFTGLGGGGIRIGEPGDKNPTAADANHSHVVTDNSFLRLGRVFAPAVGVAVFQSGTNRITHNNFRDLYYTAISVGWNWGYQSTPCRANQIDNNIIELIGQGRLSDLGGIYTLGPQPGTRIHHNIIRDIESHDYGGWGLYTDEGSSGILMEDNSVYRCKSAGFHQHYGRDNVIRNNIFAFNREHALMRTRAENHRSFTFTNNVVIQDSGSFLGGDWSGTTNQIWLDQNVFWDTRLGMKAALYRMGKDSWSEWHARGFDVRSIIGDPLLTYPKVPEAGFQPNSPVFANEFLTIDMPDVGKRGRATRE